MPRALAPLKPGYARYPAYTGHNRQIKINGPAYTRLNIQGRRRQNAARDINQILNNEEARNNERQQRLNENNAVMRLAAPAAPAAPVVNRLNELEQILNNEAAKNQERQKRQKENKAIMRQAELDLILRKEAARNQERQKQLKENKAIMRQAELDQMIRKAQSLDAKNAQIIKEGNELINKIEDIRIGALNLTDRHDFQKYIRRPKPDINTVNTTLERVSAMAKTAKRELEGFVEEVVKEDGHKDPKDCTVQVLMFSLREPGQNKNKKNKNKNKKQKVRSIVYEGHRYYQVGGKIKVHANNRISLFTENEGTSEGKHPAEFLNDSDKDKLRKNRRYVNHLDAMNPNFYLALLELANEKDFAKRLENYFLSLGYPNLVYIFDMDHMPRGVKGDKKRTTKSVFNIKLRNLSILDKMNHKYIKYELNKTADEFGQLFNLPMMNYTGHENPRANSCFVNAILHTFYGSFERRNAKGARYYPELTYARLCEIIGLKNKEQDIGLTIKQACNTFFEKYRIGLDVYNVFHELLISFRSSRFTNSGDMSPHIMSMVVHGDHAYEINKNVRVLRAVPNTIEWNEATSIYVSDRYPFRYFNEETLDGENNVTDAIEWSVVFASTTTEITKHITNHKTKNIKIIYDRCMRQLLLEMCYKHKYIPDVTISQGNVISIKFTVDDVNVSILSMVVNEVDEHAHNLTKEIYVDFSNADKAFYTAVINKNYLSEYTQADSNIENYYMCRPARGRFTRRESNYLFNAVDINKAYSTCLREIQVVPVFGYFDNYVVYDGSAIKPHSKYIVSSNVSDASHALLFDRTTIKCFGFVLQYAQKLGIPFCIRFMKHPSKLVPAAFAKAVDELYANESIPMASRKFIANKTMGLLEKRDNLNKKTISKLFTTYAEAQYYAVKYGGEVEKIKFNQRECVENEMLLPEPVIEKSATSLRINGMEWDQFGNLDWNCNDLHTAVPAPKPKPDPESINAVLTNVVYVVKVSKTTTLSNGFRHLKDMIYDTMKIKIMDLYNRAVAGGLFVYGVRTDCILTSATKEEAEAVFKFDNKLGGVKWETDKDADSTVIQQQEITPMTIKLHKINQIHVANEFDTNEISAHIEKHNRIIIKGTYAGVGKTTAFKKFAAKDNKKVLFVTPYNNLAFEFKKEGCEAVTINRLLGFFGEDSEYIKVKHVNVDSYDTIIFDEVYLNQISTLKRIDRYIENHPNIKFGATGDIFQLNAIETQECNLLDEDDCEATENYNTKKETIVGKVFPNQINLEINKRLTNEADRTKLKTLKNDLFNLDKPIMKTLKQYGFKIIDDLEKVTTKKNICLFNHMANRVAKLIHKKYADIPQKGCVTVDDIPYYKGMMLVCKERYSDKGFSLYVNNMYRVESINQKTFSVIDPYEDDAQHVILKTAKLTKHFKLPYALTLHSVQGMSINEPLTIFNIDSPYVDRKFVYTAITRATDLKNVTIFEADAEDIEIQCENKFKLYLNQKIAGYARQD